MQIAYIRVSTVKFQPKTHNAQKNYRNYSNLPERATRSTFTTFSRLARSTKDLLNIVELLNKKGVALVSNK